MSTATTEESSLVQCACGCGMWMSPIGARGRPRRYLLNHHRRGVRSSRLTVKAPEKSTRATSRVALVVHLSPRALRPLDDYRRYVYKMTGRSIGRSEALDTMAREGLKRHGFK